MQYEMGRFLVWPANSSTTMDAKVAQDFLKGKDGRAASGTLFMVNPLRDGTTRARAISRLSAFGKEKVRRTCLWGPPHLPLLSESYIALTISSSLLSKEVLFRYNTWFKVSQRLGPAGKKFLESQLNRPLDNVEVCANHAYVRWCSSGCVIFFELPVDCQRNAILNGT